MSTVEDRCAEHQRAIEHLSSELARAQQIEQRISLLRLATFVAAAIAAGTALARGDARFLALAVALAVAFIAGVVAHARMLSRMEATRVRRAVHERHTMRMLGTWQQLAPANTAWLPPDHAYASDLDLVGAGSLIQRIDVSQTLAGERALAEALGEPASYEVVAARQAAVRELCALTSFRSELETLAGAHKQQSEKLDFRPFMQLFERPRLFTEKRWLWPVMLVSVTATLSTTLAAQLAWIPRGVPWLFVFAQAVLLWSLRERVHGTLNLVTARLGFAQAYEGMLRLVEQQEFQTAHLQNLKRALSSEQLPASRQLARLARYEGFAQLRTQGPLYIVLNVLTLWDLFCLERIERFVRMVGPRCELWFKTIGELEMLCSLATLMHIEDHTCFPELAVHGAGLHARELTHPLLLRATRIGNDLDIPGPGSVVIVTGSNMAGKSTLLRALGLNVALAWAGGVVCARTFSLPRVRLRASMRIDDSLQRGASYFHAELSRLRMVVDALETGAPVLFLLDELLRGTNAHARHQGARAVLLHLLKRGALGVVATHDIALSTLAEELPGHAVNVHFTDVFEDGQMRFDYRLREGVVKTSNALRLLSMAGIDVEVDDALS